MKPARFCALSASGQVHVDESKVSAGVAACELGDSLLMRNIVCGNIVSGRVFPLIFEAHGRDRGGPASLRSMAFFREVDAAPAVYHELDEAQKRHVAVGVRDLFFARNRGLLDSTERDLLDRMVALIDDVPYGHLDGDTMAFSCCPTRSHQVLRFTPHLSALPTADQPYFAQVKVCPRLGGSRPLSHETAATEATAASGVGGGAGATSAFNENSQGYLQAQQVEYWQTQQMAPVHASQEDADDWMQNHWGSLVPLPPTNGANEAAVPRFDIEHDKGEFVIGRSTTADLVITNRWVGRHHLTIRRVEHLPGELPVVEIVSSARNATYVNGKKLERFQPQPLLFGDVISLVINNEDTCAVKQKHLFAVFQWQAFRLPDAVLFAVFVNAAELSFHNFENILQLDRTFRIPGPPLRYRLTGAWHQHAHHQIFCAQLDGDEAAVRVLQQLPHHGSALFSTPLNACSRGGSRFIFQSSTLSSALTDAVRASGLLDQLHAAPRSPGSGSSADVGASEAAGAPWELVRVNPVFRCNRFEPGDSAFSSHRDTPYFDRARCHISKYTLLLYLTGGEGTAATPALQINGTALESLGPLSVVIFDQRYLHEGHPYVTGSKVFLRTELIFRVPRAELQRCPRAAALFSTACYMTGEANFHASGGGGGQQAALSKYASRCYERVNELHWGISEQRAIGFAAGDDVVSSTGVQNALGGKRRAPPRRSRRLKRHRVSAPSGAPVDLDTEAHMQLGATYVLKRLVHGSGAAAHSATSFITDGATYWFPRRAGPLKHVAVLAVLDYFNAALPLSRKAGLRACKTSMGGTNERKTFRSLCDSRIVCRPGPKDQADGECSNEAWVWSQLAQEHVEVCRKVKLHADACVPTRARTRHRQQKQKTNEKETMIENKDEEQDYEQEDEQEIRSGGVDIQSVTAEGKQALLADIMGEQPPADRTIDHCCPFHHYIPDHIRNEIYSDDDDDAPENFCSHKCSRVVDLFEQCREYSEKELAAAPLVLLGRKVLVDESCVCVHGDKIYIGERCGSEPAPAINFAACWNCEGLLPPQFVGLKAKIHAPRLLLPPVCFTECAHGYRLCLDFFCNDFMLTADLERTVPVPKYINGCEDICPDINGYSGEGRLPAPFCEEVCPGFDADEDYHFGGGGFKLQPPSYDFSSGTRAAGGAGSDTDTPL